MLLFTLLQVDKTCNSSIPSSCENSFRMDCPTSLPLVSALPVFVCSPKGLHRNALLLCHTALTLYVVAIVCFPVRALQVFSDLDGVVKQRRQEMMESSSSGSQTPDYDKMTGVFALSTVQTMCPFMSLYEFHMCCTSSDLSAV